MTAEVRQTLGEISQIICSTVPTQRIYLFGSYAYGDPDGESDFDLYVIMPDDVGMREIDAMHLMRAAIHKAGYHMPMDILAGYSSGFDARRLAPTLERTIYRKGILLHEQHLGGHKAVV